MTRDTTHTGPFYPHGMPTLPEHDPGKVRPAPIVPSHHELHRIANENSPDLVPADVPISDAEEFHGTDGSTASVCHFPGGVILGCTSGIEPVDVYLDVAGARALAASILRAADAAERAVAGRSEELHFPY